MSAERLFENSIETARERRILQPGAGVSGDQNGSSAPATSLQRPENADPIPIRQLVVRHQQAYGGEVVARNARLRRAVGAHVIPAPVQQQL